MKPGIKTILQLLRIATAFIFAGHGWFALHLKTQWYAFLHTAGIHAPYDTPVMQTIGVLDLVIALSVLVKPLPGILLWAVFWAFLTALMRPLSGDSWFEFVERAGNWTCPLVLYLLLRNNEFKD